MGVKFHNVEQQRSAPSLYHTQVLDRVFRILNCFSSERPLHTFTELLGRTKLPKSTLYRLLQVLEAYGLLEYDDAKGGYGLGVKIFELGSIALASLDLNRVATPILEDLVRRTGETAHLGVLDGSEVVFVAKVESRHPVRIPSGVGLRTPAYCTGVGKAILSALSDDELETYLSRSRLQPFTKKTIVSHSELKKELSVTRERGYALNQGEMTEDVRCVGAPIREFTGKVIAGISVAGPAYRVTPAKQLEFAKLVREAARSVSKQLGFRSDGSPEKENRIEAHGRLAGRA